MGKNTFTAAAAEMIRAIESLLAEPIAAGANGGPAQSPVSLNPASPSSSLSLMNPAPRATSSTLTSSDSPALGLSLTDAAATQLVPEFQAPLPSAPSAQTGIVHPPVDVPDLGAAVRNFDDENLLTAVVKVERVGQLLDALRVAIAHEVQTRTSVAMPSDPQVSLAHRYGFTSARALLQQATGASGQTITRRLRIGKVCSPRQSLIGEVLPATHEHMGAALFTGKLHIDSADQICRGLAKLPHAVPFDHIELAEKVLTSFATGVEYVPGIFESTENDHVQGSTAADGDAGADGSQQMNPWFREHSDDIRVRAQGWIAALDQEGTRPREEQVARRFLHIGKEIDGLVPIRGALLPEVAAGIGRVIDAVTNPRQRTVDTAGGGSPGAAGSDSEGADDHPDPLVTEVATPAQKRHDALAAIVQAALKHADMPKLGGEAVSLTIQVNSEDLTKPRGVAWHVDAQGDLAPVDAAAARHAACVGGVLRVQQTGSGRIIGLESTARIFNAQQRKAIMLRDGGCVILGCGQSAIWCEIHHVHEYSAGGPTHTDNGVLLCWFHHRYLEQHGWEIRMLEGVPQVKAPPWIDPLQRWRKARSVHHPPDLDKLLDPD